MEIQKLRREYRSKGLRKKELAISPFEQFRKWFDEAVGAEIVEPNAMSLATCSHEGKPSCRTVLLKIFDEKGFIFFTNFESRKAQDIGANPSVAAVFLWKEMERQVIIEGKAQKISTPESEAYFFHRPRGSQLGCWASHQDAILDSREELSQKYAKLEELYKGREIPCPEFWGGFRIVPERFEFWQGQNNRLHDRFEYVLSKGDWHIKRLSP